MRRIRANAIAILTAAWILGTFYYLWQDGKPRSAAAGGSGRGGQRAAGRPEARREESAVPLGVSDRAGRAELGLFGLVPASSP